MEALLSECIADNELGQEIERRSKLFTVPSDCVLFHQGDRPTALYFLKRGTVELAMTAHDLTVLTLRAHAGSIVGLPGVLSNRPYSMEARALSGAQICQLSPSDFQEMIAANPRLATQILRILASEFQSIHQILLDTPSH